MADSVVDLSDKLSQVLTIADLTVDSAVDPLVERKTRHSQALQTIDDQIKALRELRKSIVSSYRQDLKSLKSRQVPQTKRPNPISPVGKTVRATINLLEDRPVLLDIVANLPEEPANYLEVYNNENCLGNVLSDGGLKIWTKNGEIPSLMGMFSVGIISAEPEINTPRMKALEKTIGLYFGKDEIGYYTDIFIIVPKQYVPVYLTAFETFLQEPNFHIFGYTNFETFLEPDSHRYRPRNVGDARNASLALGCLLPRDFILISDDDRLHMKFHLDVIEDVNSEGKKCYKWADTIQRSQRQKLEVLRDHIVEHLMTPNNALLGFHSYNDLRGFSQSSATREDLHPLIIGPEKAKCAQLIAMNMRILREDNITYPSIRMCEDNAFQYCISQKYNFASTCLITHGSPNEDNVPSSCRKESNGHVSSYTWEDRAEWKKLLDSGVIRVFNNKVDIRWSVKGKYFICPTLQQVRDLGEEYKRDSRVGWRFVGNLFAEFRDKIVHN